MKNFKKGLSKTVAPLYFADTYAHRHTWIPHKARCRFSNDGYGAPYPGHALPRRDSGRGYKISPIRHKGA